jgi:hypothetical protein
LRLVATTDGADSPGGSVPADAEGAIARSERLLLDELSDRLDTLKIFRARGDERSGEILEQFGAQGPVESQMLEQLGDRAPLRHPDRFEEAHRSVMHALEVYDRNAARQPSSLRVGPLKPAASFFVQLLIRVVVRDHQRSVVGHLRELYALRESASAPGTPESRVLWAARRQADRLAPGLDKKSGGLPAFVLGGAVLSGVTSILQRATRNGALLLAIAAVVATLALAAFWCVLTAAAIARRRTRICLDGPLRALWETIGSAGDPPRDRSRQFAIYAAILLVLAWIVVPVALTIAVKIR